VTADQMTIPGVGKTKRTHFTAAKRAALTHWLQQNKAALEGKAIVDILDEWNKAALFPVTKHIIRDTILSAVAGTVPMYAKRQTLPRTKKTDLKSMIAEFEVRMSALEERFKAWMNAK